MRKILIPVTLAASLAGCVTAGDITTIITQVQNATVQACGFLPAAESVASAIAVMFGGPAGGVIVADVEQAAQAICSAVATQPQPKSLSLRTKRQITVVVRGIPIKGHFVR